MASTSKSSTIPALQFQGENCQLKQLHFHARSEHFIKKDAAALEIHLIHKIPNRPEGSRNVVVGILLNPVVGGPKIKSLMALNQLLTKRSTPSFAPDNGGDADEFDLRGFVPAKPYRFYRYEGSLTTPPYSETISWGVISEVREADETSINHIVRTCTHETRPLQPLNRRFVLRNFA